MGVTLPSRPKEGSASGRLCGACAKLDFAAMFAKETKQIAMGPVSDYSDLNCPFCGLIAKSIHLGWEEKGDPKSASPGGHARSPELFIQSRSPLSVQIDGHVQHPQPRLLLAVDQKPPGFKETRGVIRQVDRVKDRFIVAEIERLPDDAAKPEYIVRRDVATTIDVELVKSWLQECQGHKHSVDDSSKTTETKDALFGGPDGFLLIDVVDECLVRLKEKTDYVALSYVWGKLATILRKNVEKPDQIPLLLTTVGNKEELAKPGALTPERVPGAKIAASVLDAMSLTRAIGQRYLWVDMFCIVQNDGNEKDRLMAVMDDVYNTATVTLVAGDGTDADAGLSGWAPPGRTPRRPRSGHPLKPTAITTPASKAHPPTTLRLALCPPSLVEEVRRSTWNTRGWTYQEQHLSRRVVYVTADEVFFACPAAGQQRRESYTTPPNPAVQQLRTGPPWWTGSLRADPDPTPYRYLGDAAALGGLEYQAAVQAYTRRELSHAEDALNAFAGVFNRFHAAPSAAAAAEIAQTQGIPAHLMQHGLLWFPSGQGGGAGGERRSTAKQRFATWSWASWVGPAEFVFADSSWLSRIVSLAPARGVPLHVAIPRWHLGGGSSDGGKSTATSQIWSQQSWAAAAAAAAAGEEGSDSRSISTEAYLGDRVGVDTAALLKGGQAAVEPPARGELGFFAAYLGADDVKLAQPAKPERFVSMEIVSGGHRGEFRFDDKGDEARGVAVDEFVLVVAADTVEGPGKLPKTQSVFLGVAMSQDAAGVVSARRVGLGFVYYAPGEDSAKPAWRYKHFRLT
ncbi:heterokaryon incompatibility protein-domain-containing protein [Lasiosphaeria miniovina]|uniref:Heterokaryon incompatibility protein-domain-containing protein n=1 Tax=Lasiosphaeria miniovina TaxID=1954250 RepID=A0AA40AVC0_9PEZI|nr:heterokaryon incompatibility protein-domain-containing protein [Lasiosphaeria miniovina]KAK0722639.1 heterokaryon incompatibility protein-domain-containing protein [Lasiosphaeria miniovina]